MEPFAYTLDESDIKREKNKARDLRNSQWWKRKTAKGICHYCGKQVLPKNMTMDHIIPIARGGKTTKGNVAPSCKECNVKKKQILPTEFNSYQKSLA